MRKRICGIVFGLFSIGWQMVQAEVPDATIQQMFHPYAAGKPSAPGLEPGTTISKDSWEAAKDYLPPEILDKIKAGEFQFTVQETTDLPVSETYIEATKKYAEHVRITTDGDLEGYVTGLPFPVLDPADPQAGLKAAWNLRHRDFGDIVQVWNKFIMVPDNGPPDREIESYYVVAYGMHRPPREGVNPNKWEKDGILFKEYWHILSPFDLKNSMSLRLRYDRDQENDRNWLYTPAGRKVRKMIVKLDEASYDSGFLNEDFFGYWGYVRSQTWKLLGSRRLLAPIGVQAASATFGGRGNWYPVNSWELREMLILEGVPKASDHPYSKRVLYIDRQTFTPVYALFYDRQGKHQKTLFEVYGNPKYNPDNEHVRVPLWVGESMIDYRNNFASMTIVNKTYYNVFLPGNFFSLDRIAARGR